MSFQLPDLGFETSALEPYIDTQTMEIHHGKHHAGYVKKLNAAIDGHSDLEGKRIEEILKNFDELVPEDIKTAVKNNGGGHANHSLFWKILTPGGAEAPEGELAEAITKSFSTLKEFIEKFNSTAATQFGSGWGWLVVGGDQELEIISTPNQDSPLLQGKTPILGIDVWEHAYYLKYQNERGTYLENIWKVVNWSVVSENYAAVS